MSLLLERADFFNSDFDLQYRWYLAEAGEAIAERYLAALHETLRLLVRQPGLGRQCRFRHPKLERLRVFHIRPPFDKHLIFYRYDQTTLFAERVMHGARVLPRRLLQPPRAED